MDGKIIISESHAKAIRLNASILANAQAAQASLWEVCKGLKEMRDGKLYKELGYQNFEEYCETEVGISRKQCYQYIAVIEKLDGDFVTPGLQKLGIKKLYLLSTLSESDREELKDRVDIDEATARQLKAEIDKLKTEKAQQADELQSLYANRDSLQEQVIELEQQVEELESRPIEVTAVSESHEVENMRIAMNKNSAEWSRRYDQLQEENLAHERQLHQTYRQQIDSLREEYAQKMDKLAAQGSNSHTVDAFITTVSDVIRSAMMRITGLGLSLLPLQTELQVKLDLVKEMIQEESET